ncbi:MAG: hypothetical protein WKF58_05305 [Ilumatobacteraceae bacterium]
MSRFFGSAAARWSPYRMVTIRLEGEVRRSEQPLVGDRSQRPVEVVRPAVKAATTARWEPEGRCLTLAPRWAHTLTRALIVPSRSWVTMTGVRLARPTKW